MPWKTRKHSGSGHHGGRKGQKFLQRDYPRFEARRRAQFMSSKLKERLAKKLSHAPIGSVYYDGHKITVNFDGQVLSNKVVVLQHEKWVGRWSRSEPVVYIDDDVPMEFRKFVAFHESAEKYLKERYGLDPNAEGHETAEAIEKRFFLRKRSIEDWNEYSRIVERVHRKEMA